MLKFDEIPLHHFLTYYGTSSYRILRIVGALQLISFLIIFHKNQKATIILVLRKQSWHRRRWWREVSHMSPVLRLYRLEVHTKPKVAISNPGREWLFIQFEVIGKGQRLMEVLCADPVLQPRQIRTTVSQTVLPRPRFTKVTRDVFTSES